jgi:F0F1-type ATP synthase assembly protein I
VPPPKTPAGRFAEYSGLALLLPASTLVGYAMGYGLDKWLGTGWLKILFLILGSVAGFYQLIRQILRDSGDGRD